MDAQLRNRNFGGQKYKPHDDPTVIEFMFRTAENSKIAKIKKEKNKKEKKKPYKRNCPTELALHERMNRYIG